MENRRLDVDLQRLYNFYEGCYGAPHLILDLWAEGKWATGGELD